MENYMNKESKRVIPREWSVGARSETGYVRSENQDRMSCVGTPFGYAYIVSDGMGGHRAGALAAQLTIETLAQALPAIQSISSAPAEIRHAVEEANRAVYERGHSGATETRGMGATVVVLFVSGSQALIAHVGDSRAYLYAGGVLRQLTRDHSRVQKMVDEGLLAAAEAASHPDASILDRAIGVAPRVEVDISGWLSLHEGERILLCSDGLHGYVADSEIITVLENEASPQELANRLVDLALQKGGEDNITVQLLEYERPGKSAWTKIVRHLTSTKTKWTGFASGIQIPTQFPLPASSTKVLAIIPGTAANGP